MGQWSNNEDHHTFIDLQLKSYNSKLEQDMTLYEEHGATLKHKCGKRIVALSLVSSSLFFWAFLFMAFLFFFFFLVCFFGLFFYLGLFSFFMAFFFVQSLIPTYGGIIVSIILSSLGQCSNNDDHHTFIFLTTQQLQLDT